MLPETLPIFFQKKTVLNEATVINIPEWKSIFFNKRLSEWFSYSKAAICFVELVELIYSTSSTKQMAAFE